MITFNCANCLSPIKAPDNLAGSKARCPRCSEVVPVPSATTAAPSPPTPAAAPYSPERRPYADEERVSARSRREDDYEEDRPRKRRDDDYEEDRPRKRRDDYDDDYDDRPRRRGGFTCPFCKASPPLVKKQVSTGGWVLFVVLLFFCLPLCFIGLFVTEEYRVCSDCGIKLG